MKYFVIKYTNYGFLITQMHMASLAVIPFALTAIYYHVMNGLDLRLQIFFVNFLVLLALFLYYLFPLLMDHIYSLNYYLNAKIITGWLIFLGYIIVLSFFKKV